MGQQTMQQEHGNGTVYGTILSVFFLFVSKFTLSDGAAIAAMLAGFTTAGITSGGSFVNAKIKAMKKYPDFWSVLVGPKPGFLLGFIVVALICATCIVLYDLNRRDPTSPRTPTRLSFRFWVADNLARVVANILLLPIFIRLCYQYVDPVWMLLLSCGIGFGVEALGMIAKRFGLLTTTKLAAKINDKIESEGK